MEPKGPEKIGEILSRLFAARGWGRKQDRLRLEHAWAEAAGAEYAPRSRVSGLRRNVLEVEVKSWHPTARAIAVRMEGAAYVGDKRVAQATVTCQLIDQSRGRGTASDGAAE